ncbi:site-specific integrase [Winogradskyella vincentii]|uniref:Site-specific integrase n=1 Tax=Winogradskyella vincentii TaxID=2877122 RepID=A0ABS7XWH9_9FLAO|nr:site-specific integrase [Winogradskyella vincentii]MCA0151731.1 site-specific integrase [Winogradskyella vincentii]
MNINKLNKLFYLNKVRLNKQNRSPIKCRLTFLGKRKTFSTGLFINPQYWNSKQQKANPPGPDNNYINTQISLISQKINEAFLFLQVSNNKYDVEDIYFQYKGENIKTHKTLLEVFDLHNRRMEKLIDIEYARSTYKKFKEAKKHTRNFINFQFGKNDVLLESIKSNFLQDFDFYLKSELGHKQITINKSIQRVRKVIKLALAEGYLQKDPFILFKPKRVSNVVIFLNSEELEALENYQFSQRRLSFIQDLFVFSCYTGLPYRELMNLKHNNIIKGFDDNLWIQMKREKTNKDLSIPLLPKAIKIINKYDSEKSIFPKISNQKYNSYLKEIGAVIGIEKKLTTHTARKTFASTVLLYNDVPMEIVSELLGHSSMKITQDSYGKVVQKKISSEIEKLKGR